MRSLHLTLFPTITLFASCAFNHERDQIVTKNGLTEIHSISGWSGEIAFRKAVESGTVANEVVALTSSTQDEVMIYFNEEGKLLRVTVFDSRKSQNQVYTARSKGGETSGRSIRVIPR